jgi:hypothetical protein
MHLFDGHEERIIGQPVVVLTDEPGKLLCHARRGLCFETFECPVEHRQLPGNDRPIIDLPGGERWCVRQVIGDQQAIVQQQIRADQVGVAGESRKTLVRGVAIAGRSQG